MAEASRGKRRSQAMQNMAMGGGMSDMLSEMSNELVHGVSEDAPPKKKMEAVMINAKERGMTVLELRVREAAARRAELKRARKEQRDKELAALHATGKRQRGAPRVCQPRLATAEEAVAAAEAGAWSELLSC